MHERVLPRSHYRRVAQDPGDGVVRAYGQLQGERGAGPQDVPVLVLLQRSALDLICSVSFWSDLSKEASGTRLDVEPRRLLRPRTDRARRIESAVRSDERVLRISSVEGWPRDELGLCGGK